MKSEHNAVDQVNNLHFKINNYSSESSAHYPSILIELLKQAAWVLIALTILFDMKNYMGV